MSVLDNFTKKVAQTAKAAAKKSGELVEVTKLNMNISAEEEKIEKTYTEIGRAVFNAYSSGEEIPEALKELCGKVVDYKRNIEEMKEKILELKNLKLCPSCSAELAIDVAFCPKCGTKQETAKKEDSTDGEAST